MKAIFNRRQFLQTGAAAGAGLALTKGLFAAGKKSVLIFTKSSGFEHDVVKTTGGKPSILEAAVTTLAGCGKTRRIGTVSPLADAIRTLAGR